MRGLLAVVALAATAGGCGPFSDGVDGSSSEVAAAVHEAAAQGQTLRLADVTDFDWDRFYVFAPYTPTEAIDKRLGFHWADAENSDIRWSDTISLLVFVRDGEVVAAFDQGNGDGYFGCVGEPAFTPSQAVLRVKRVEEGANVFDRVAAPGRRTGPGCAIF